jgi:hypothetical protein
LRTDADAAQAALLSITDLPEGSTSRPSTPALSTPFVGPKACSRYEAQMSATDTDRTAAGSVVFLNGDAEQVGSDTEVYSSAEVARGLSSALGDEGFSKCLKAALEPELTANLSAGEKLVSLSVLRVPVKTAEELGVDAAIGFVMDSTLTVDGERVLVRSALVALTSGRASSTVSLEARSLSALTGLVDAAAKKLRLNAPQTTAMLPSSA